VTGKIILHSLALLTILLMAASTAHGKTYVDWEGEYYIEYPDEWSEVPYSRVVGFLLSQQISPNEFTYRLAVSEKTEEPIFAGVYMFVSTYDVGNLTDRQIDSALVEIGKSNGSKHVAGSLTDVTKKFRSGQPVYDESQRAVAIFDQIADAVTNNVLLEIRKFYDKGIVVFYCYAPVDRFESVRPRFISILNSFSTENLEQFAQSSEDVKIVDVTDRNVDDMEITGHENDTEGKESDNLIETVLIVLLAVVVLIGVCYSITRKKKK
jgi:hypothetical protein